MKNLTLLFLFTILFIIPSKAQVDRTKMPEAGPAPEIKIGQYESFTLENGLKVFVVENHKLPRIAFSLVLDRDPIMEGNSAGYVSAAGSLLRTGTQTRTKDELDKEIDFIGAKLSTSSTGVFGLALTQHSEKLLELISDIVLNANFKQDELDKILLRMKSDLESEKDDPQAIASNVKRVLLYGKDHPYGENMTEETIKNISLKECEDYYKTFFKPNIAYLAVVGDITKSEAKNLVEKYFGSWKKGEIPHYTYKTPEQPNNTQVAIVDRPNSVQSVVNVTYPIQLKPGSEDVIKARVMNTLLGGGVFRLFYNLREKHAYTYGAYSSLSSDKLIGSFAAYANVRNSVTDSAVTQILYEMKRIRDEKVPDEELQKVKNYITGNFAIGLENPQTIANFAINTARYNLPQDYYANYLKNVAAVTPEDVKKEADKYITPENAYVVVVGNADSIAKGLSKFGGEKYYDKDGNEIDTSSAGVPEGMSADEVIDNYIKAIGGRENLASVKDRTTIMRATIQNNKVTMIINQKTPDKFKQEINFGGMSQVVVFNGKTGQMKVGDNKIPITGDEAQRQKYEAMMDLVLHLDSLEIKTKLAGTEKVDGKDTYKIEMTLPTGTKWIQYYSTDTGLKVKEEKTITSPQGTFTQETLYSDYKDVEGVKYPFTISQSVGPQHFTFNVSTIKVNTGLKDDIFEAE